ncbi:MAG: DUF2065 family protein [Acidobacteria bacterium]|nr:DUF2065 family protein [Acidobacteriota bacterium]
MRLLLALLPALGLMLVLEGMPYFATPERTRKLLAYMAGQPDWVLRGFGLMLLGSGLLALWMARDLGA